jgi:uncharacterized membrane protein
MVTASADLSPVTLRVARSVHRLLLLGALAWCAALAAAPFLHGLGGSFEGASALLYGFFHPICHQLDSHSLHLAGAKLGVCTRCSSIYFSFLLGLLLYPAVRELRATSLPHRLILAGALLPLALDGTLALLGVHAGTLWSRMLTGSLFGLTAAFFIMPAAVEGTAQLLASRTLPIHPHHPQEGLTDATET